MTDKKTSADFISLSDVKEEAEVDKNNPWKDDALERQKFAKPLTDLVISAKGAPFCIAVDGGWGSGKTFFLKRWCVEFSKQGEAIYFNAWEDDFHADPLTAIIGQLWQNIKSPVLKEICDLMKKILGTIVKKTTKITLHYCGSGLVSDLATDDLQTVERKTVDEYLGARQSICTLKNLLKKLADKTKKETMKPLVIVVDELDRCRPTFAIELLERVKHIVGVQGIVFVFGINQKGLEKSIQSVYGDIDATDYLRRFFDVGMTLPKAEASKYCVHLINKRKITKVIEKSPVCQKTRNIYVGAKCIEWKGGRGITIKTDLPIIVDCMGLSLRQIEQAVRMLSIVLHNNKNKGMFRPERWWVVFVLLRIKDRDLYVKFINKDCAIKDVLDGMLSSLSWEDDRKTFLTRDLLPCIERMMSIFYFCSGEDRQEIVDELEQVSRGLRGKGILPTACRYVPQKIIEMKDSSIPLRLALDLIEKIKSTVKLEGSGELDTKKLFYPSRRQVARLLEWGDYWRE